MSFVATEIKNIKQAWSSTISLTFVIHLIIVLSLGALMLSFVSDYLSFIQNRSGLVLNDWVLNSIPSADLSWYIFPIIHVCTILTIINLCYYPKMLLVALQTYLVVTIARLSCIYFFPLNPPEGLVLLVDPVNQYLFYGKQVITKDLFFSGHTAAQFLLFMVVQNKNLKKLFFILTLLLVIFLLIQHVHYTIDVLAAPIFVWLSFRLVLWVNKKYFFKEMNVFE